MPYRIEFAEAAEHDLELIFDHLFESYLSFGESTDQALDHAGQRIKGIRASAERLALFPERGASRDDILPGLRFMVMERAALAEVLKQRRAGGFVSGDKMDERIAAMLARKREAHAVQD